MKIKISRKQQGEAVKVKALMVFMNNLWLDRNKHNANIIYFVICDTFLTASRIAGRYNLKEYDSLMALKIY